MLLYPKKLKGVYKMEIFKSKHIGCYGVVYNDKGEVLLIKKSRGAYKGLLDLPGGGIDYGESADDTLRREFSEEVGLSIKEYQLKTVVTNYVVWDLDENHKEDLQHVAIIYDVTDDSQDYKKIKKEADGLDSLGAGWYSVKDLKLEELSPLARVIKES